MKTENLNLLLQKVAVQPGRCTVEEIDAAMDFYQSFNDQLKIFRAVHGDPIGLTVESIMDCLVDDRVYVVHK